LHCASALSFSDTLELSEANIQERANAMMPLEKKKLFVTTILTNSMIDLIEITNGLGVSTNVSVKAPGKSVVNERFSLLELYDTTMIQVHSISIILK
jgi:hypothetical protein